MSDCCCIVSFCDFLEAFLFYFFSIFFFYFILSAFFLFESTSWSLCSVFPHFSHFACPFLGSTVVFVCFLSCGVLLLCLLVWFSASSDLVFHLLDYFRARRVESLNLCLASCVCADNLFAADLWILVVIESQCPLIWLPFEWLVSLVSRLRWRV